jgi:hypothetical protein
MGTDRDIAMLVPQRQDIDISIFIWKPQGRHKNPEFCFSGEVEQLQLPDNHKSLVSLGRRIGPVIGMECSGFPIFRI